MAWRKFKFRRTPDRFTKIVPLVRQNIHIPQPAEKPIDIHAKDLIKKEYVSSKDWWFTKHRRGTHREKIGEDPLEMRAIPKSMLRGTLPERIIYQYLVKNLRMVDGIDFTFQSSQSGGRIELGGIVVDFLFPNFFMIIQVQGPTHDTFLRSQKDTEQLGLLAEMGYRVFEITDEMIYNECRLENWMRNTFNLGGTGGSAGSSTASVTSVYSSQQEKELEDPEAVYTESMMNKIAEELNGIRNAQ